MRFALIDAKKAEVPVTTACAVLNVSVSGFYAWKRRPMSSRQRSDMILLAHIRAEFATSNETYGSRHAEGVCCTTDTCGAARKWLGNRASPGGAADAREQPESSTKDAFQEND